MSSSTALFAVAAVLTVLRLPMLDWEVRLLLSLVSLPSPQSLCPTLVDIDSECDT